MSLVESHVWGPNDHSNPIYLTMITGGNGGLIGIEHNKNGQVVEGISQ